MTKGAEWTMDAVVADASGRQFGSVLRATVEVDKRRDGKAFHWVRSWLVNAGGPKQPLGEMAHFLQKHKSDVFPLNQGSNAGQAKRGLRLEIGQSWSKESKTGLRKYQVIAMEDMSAGGKVYKQCPRIRVTRADGVVTEDYWIAAGVGRIRSELSYTYGFSVSFVAARIQSREGVRF